MSPERHQQIEDIFHAALALDPSARAAFLDQACCGNDETLRREIESLLDYKERTQSPLEVPVFYDAFRALAESDSESLIGKTVSHYQILSRIGEGGMGQVYAALDVRLKRKVALKLLPASFIEDEKQVRRLHHEARAASALKHPNIVTIYELGQAESLHFIAMEFVEGQTLRRKMVAQMPFHEVLNIAIQVASGLAAAHQADILHRDIKPENVMAGEDGYVKILDFGIAKFKERQDPAEIASVVNIEASVAAGTLSYMSPEQARGEPLDARTDIFSLGILLFEMIAGKKPFSCTNQTEMLHSVFHGEAPNLSAHRQNVPFELQRIVGKALKKNRDERYRSAREMLADLKEFKDGTDGALDARERANRMLVQFLSMYAVDERALIPITKLWFVHHHSNLERGERGRRLFRKSLCQGMLRSSALGLLILILATAAAAWLSVREDWESVRLSDGHTAAVRRAVFSPDGRLLVSVGEDKKVMVWDFAQRERLATLTDHTDWVTSVDFSPDGRWFATGSRDKIVIVWDAKRLERIAVLREHQAAVNAVVFSPDGRFLASASESPDFRTVLWSVVAFQKVREFPCGSAYPNLRFSPNGRWLMSSSCLSIWDVATGQQVAGEQHGGNWSSFSPDGKREVSVSGGGDVFFFDMSEFWDRTKELVLAHQEAHQDNGRAVAYSPDGRLVATGADDIILWDAETQTKLARLEHTAIVWSLAFSPDGRWLVSTHGDGAILLWDVKERALAANFNEHGAPVRAVAFSSDGKRIASGGEDRSVIIWDTEHLTEEAVLLEHTSRVVGIAFSRNEELLASCDWRGNIILWDILRRQPRFTFKSPGGDSYGLAISPDGHWLANSHGVYETEKGHQVVDFISGIKGTRGGVYGVAFSQDGGLLASVTEFGQIFLWDPNTWQLLDKVELTGSQLITVSFSPDGKWLVTGEDEGAIRLWSINPLRQAAIIGHHSARIKSVAFSPDGKQIASASDDQTIALWDIRRRSLVTRIGTHSAPVLSVAFSSDGKRLVSGEHDKSVRLYTRHHSLWGYNLD